MVDDQRDTVVVEKERSNPLGWIIGILVVLILLALFFNYGGLNMFNDTGTSAPAGNSVDVDANVQTPAAQ